MFYNLTTMELNGGEAQYMIIPDVPDDEPLPVSSPAKAIKTVSSLERIEAKLDALLARQGISPASIERKLNDEATQ